MFKKQSKNTAKLISMISDITFFMSITAFISYLIIDNAFNWEILMLVAILVFSYLLILKKPDFRYFD